MTVRRLHLVWTLWLLVFIVIVISVTFFLIPQNTPRTCHLSHKVKDLEVSCFDRQNQTYTFGAQFAFQPPGSLLFFQCGKALGQGRFQQKKSSSIGRFGNCESENAPGPPLPQCQA